MCGIRLSSTASRYPLALCSASSVRRPLHPPVGFSCRVTAHRPLHQSRLMIDIGATGIMYLSVVMSRVEFA